MLTILIVSLLSSAPDPLDKIRKGRDQRSKTVRIMAYGFAACHFAHQGRRYAYDADRLRTPDARDRARFFWAALKKASALAKRDTDDGIPCDGQDFGLLMGCLAAARFPNDAPRCGDPEREIAIKLALVDLPELAQ